MKVINFITETSTIQIIGHSGLFDPIYYIKNNKDLHDIGTESLRHYHIYGWKEGRKPNQFFDPRWYILQNRDVRQDPLLHYITHGEHEGRRPISWFDPVWYKKNYSIPEGMLALTHYLLNRQRPEIRPIPEFDPAFYLKTYTDVAAANMDPLEHYMLQGFREDRRPFAGFDPLYYRRRYLKSIPDTNPLLHYLNNKSRPDIYPAKPTNEITVFRDVKRFSRAGSLFEKQKKLPQNAVKRARIFAYYLPQFHSIPENNTWWGKGFTEWTNTARAMPRFHGHYQPRIPRDLGHYTLNSSTLLSQQAKMARDAGIEGFVFYFYWFNQQRLLETPLEILLKHPEIDLPFCLMWANENWSRRWDGSEDDLLIAQDYHTDDDVALIDCFARHMKDPRYIHVNKRPLLKIYRPDTIPNTQKTIARWRKIFKNRHNLTPLIITGQAFNSADPRPFGADGAFEFPPHKIVNGRPLLNNDVTLFDEDFSGQIYDYEDIVTHALQEAPPPYPLIRTACPSWDNDARRQGEGLVLHGSTPDLYKKWLNGIINYAQNNPFHNETIVCVNAWNEWAEGAYLEPDQHFGSAYLNATAEACAGFNTTLNTTKLLLIGHDAFPAGSQTLLLEIARTLKSTRGIDLRFILLDGGALLDQYRALAPVDILPPDTPDLSAKLTQLRHNGFHHAILNSAASSPISAALNSAQIAFTFLIHELPYIIQERHLRPSLDIACTLAQTIITPAPFVAHQLLLSNNPKLHILPQGLYTHIQYSTATRQNLRTHIGINESEKLIIGIGYADIRKGFDLFIQLWRNLPSTTHAVWLGDIDPTLHKGLARDLEYASKSKRFHLLGHVKNINEWLSAADFFTLTSREDPYPSVVLEAIAAGLPCLAFNETGGIPDLLHSLNAEPHALLQHHILPFGHIQEMALTLSKSPAPTAQQRKLQSNRMAQRFNFTHYADRLLSYTIPDLPRVSVIVPSYNYAHYLAQRLASIFAQTHPILEIIVLDDASQDGSPTIAKETARHWGRTIRLVTSRTPSGSVFHQWQKGLELARGEWVWIAEADDLCDSTFIETLLNAALQTPNAVMAFCDSRAIDTEGRVLYPSYKPYCAESTGILLDHDACFNGRNFIQSCLSERNTILNVSSAIFKRTALRKALQRCKNDLKTYKIAGDWRTYIELLDHDNAEVIYLSKTLNSHRRHDQSATHSLDYTIHLNEIQSIHTLLQRRFTLPAEKITIQNQYRKYIDKTFTKQKIQSL
ncbi:glycoside hydrolase family 99-like domain-containing protein [Neokomagataea sp. TBRC 2177]|uniref:Glycoside hydrolase family 99-like domain-containing protein n=1 Tax=Neokomagataea anthophila TaxID=2826925 RepID=A0ABS5E889_9PROT|nr:glycoside hydrolase family 99-like domain-containing protein [Neokomagataea anthophila]